MSLHLKCVFLFFKDVVKKPDYFIVLFNGTATADHFRLSKIGSAEHILWRRIKENADSLIKPNVSHAQHILLTNPFAVFYAQETVVEFGLQEFPCKIASTSKKLSRVKRSLITSRQLYFRYWHQRICLYFLIVCHPF